MAEIIGVGCTHYPPLITPDEDRGFPINVTLNRDDRLPEELKNPLNWPPPMQMSTATIRASPPPLSTGRDWSRGSGVSARTSSTSTPISLSSSEMTSTRISGRT